MTFRTPCKGVHVSMRLLDVYSRCKAKDRRMKTSLRRKTDAGIDKTTEFMFAGINVHVPTQTHFSPSSWARVKIRGAQNIFMPKYINFNAIMITLDSIEKIKTERNDNKIA